jgi:hypothetical protein
MSLPGQTLVWVQSVLHRFLDGSGPRAKILDPKLPTPPAKVVAERPSQRSILTHPSEREYFDSIAPRSVADAPLPSFDPGVFDNELLKLKLYSIIDPRSPSLAREPEGNIVEGTYMGTQVALTEAYSRIEQT